MKLRYCNESDEFCHRWHRWRFHDAITGSDPGQYLHHARLLPVLWTQGYPTGVSSGVKNYCVLMVSPGISKYFDSASVNGQRFSSASAVQSCGWSGCPPIQKRDLHIENLTLSPNLWPKGSIEFMPSKNPLVVVLLWKDENRGCEKSKSFLRRTWYMGIEA